MATLARPVSESADREVDRREAGCARGVYRKIEAAEVEPVGYSPRGDIEERSGERLPPVHSGSRSQTASSSELPTSCGITSSVLHPKIAETTAGAEDDGGVFTVEAAFAIPSVFEGPTNGFKR